MPRNRPGEYESDLQSHPKKRNNLAHPVSRRSVPAMPRGPKGEKRPRRCDRQRRPRHADRDGEIEDNISTPESEGKDPAAVALGGGAGRRGLRGMSAKRRKEIARKAAKRGTRPHRAFRAPVVGSTIACPRAATRAPLPRLLGRAAPR